MTIRTALDQGSRLLEDAGVSAPRLTAEVLLSHALGRERVYLYAHPEQELEHNPWLHYGRYLHERLQGRPTQYITHRQEFYGREFRVSDGVFIPRPETEHLIETALRLARGARSVVDVGCGSGAIAATLSLELDRPVRATDVSMRALEAASENARRLGARVEVLACDLVSAFAARSLDLVASNPPYIPTTEEPGLPREVRDYEPRQALYAGPDGLDAYRRLIAEAERVLVPGGWLIMELGYRQMEAVVALCGPAWEPPEVIADLAGLPRVFAARLGA
ncbi:MAG TPA: peptide chain release factor N(5)-glutamine methyltransferase [Bryobacteraceae bacterium]|nr:peptide chain release factor N(5)-glutamine methyltransferase [Bryobacteraceae bacterium]